MVARVGEPVLVGGSFLALFFAALVSLLALRRLDGTRWGDRLRQRFVLGVPWGTAVVVVLVVCVYLFVQGAWESLADPLVVPFRSWSYTYPLGMLTASFAHGSVGHITGNLLTTVVFATVAEYTWGHYPTGRGRQTFDSPLTNPYVRIGLFVVSVFLVGLAVSLFVPGPSIGFSGVVFAFAGFALVTSPFRAVLAIVGVRIVRTLYFALLDPAPIEYARPAFVEPWFANVSVQGHAFGLLVGVLLGVAVLYHRSDTPPVRHVWYATLAFAVMETLYALYWYVGADGYLLFRAAGLAAVLVVVALVAGAVAAAGNPGSPRTDLSWRHLAVGGLVAVVVATSGVAAFYNLADVSGVDREDAVEVRDYAVFYAEDVEYGYVAAVNLPWPLSELSASARASGVIVASERRNVWEEVVSAGRLSLDGRATVSVGGLGWRERVVANRTGWDAIDGGSTYKVFLRSRDEPRRLAYSADPVELAPRVAGHNLSIDPVESGYALDVTRNNSTVRTVPLPGTNESVQVAGFAVERRNDSLFATHEGTRVRLARYERDAE